MRCVDRRSALEPGLLRQIHDTIIHRTAAEQLLYGVSLERNRALGLSVPDARARAIPRDVNGGQGDSLFRGKVGLFGEHRKCKLACVMTSGYRCLDVASRRRRHQHLFHQCSTSALGKRQQMIQKGHGTEISLVPRSSQPPIWGRKAARMLRQLSHQILAHNERNLNSGSDCAAGPA